MICKKCIKKILGVKNEKKKINKTYKEKIKKAFKKLSYSSSSYKNW